MPETFVKISQNSAIRIERLRREGVQDEQLVQALEQRNPQLLQGYAAAAELDMIAWADYASEHGEQLKAAIQEGYQMTFNTVLGVRNWLLFALDMEAGADYVEGEGRVDGLQLDAQQLERVRHTLAVNWVTVQQPDQTVSLMLRALAHDSM
ncbi:hypothetical protein [Paenibacillus kandeliae]|uniref:hypothetical protein n=1 Tax=Paenibacillus kandeliae TaxID=3231269 RepID=UPI003458920A